MRRLPVGTGSVNPPLAPETPTLWAYRAPAPGWFAIVPAGMLATFTDGMLPTFTDGMVPTFTDGKLETFTDGMLETLTDGSDVTKTDWLGAIESAGSCETAIVWFGASDTSGNDETCTLASGVRCAVTCAFGMRSTLQLPFCCTAGELATLMLGVLLMLTLPAMLAVPATLITPGFCAVLVMTTASGPDASAARGATNATSASAASLVRFMGPPFVAFQQVSWRGDLVPSTPRTRGGANGSTKNAAPGSCRRLLVGVNAL